MTPTTDAGLLPADALWAAGSLSWGVAAVVGGHAYSWVGATVVALNLVVAVLFLRRERARAQAGLWPSLLAAACVAMGAVAIAQAPPPSSFAWWASAMFVLGGVGTMLSLWTLGRSFSVLPARRGIVVRGPYRWVRHPAYACELLMVAACSAAGDGWARWWPLAVTLLLVVVRIQLEERLLGVSKRYLRYRERVPQRLVYGLW